MKKYLFLDRDGTLVYEPHDYQVDALSKVRFLKGVIPALLQLKDAGFTFVMVSNQDGLGTDSYPLETFTPAHEFILHTLEDQGIHFENILLCPHKPEDHCSCRKPETGLVHSYLISTDWDREHSYFIGDRDTDLRMAQNMGIQGIRVGDMRDDLGSGFAKTCDIDPESPFANVKPLSWLEIADMLCAKKKRTASYKRQTKETDIDIAVDLDTTGHNSISTGIGFFDHMLDQIASHAGFSLQVKVKGDLNVDQHHTVEDTALALGTVLKQALGDKRGIGRFGFIVPMDEVLAEISFADKDCATLDSTAKATGCDGDTGVGVALDISGRPHADFTFDASFTRDCVGDFETQMVSHFFESLAVTMGLTLHMKVNEGNAHHQVEALFKAFGRALRPAITVIGHELPSTKGML